MTSETCVEKYRFLLAENNNMVRSMIKKSLTPFGAKIIEATDGRQGLDLLAGGNLNLVITNTELPEIDGIELCKHIKKKAATKAIPVIMFSSGESEKHIEKAFKAGASSCLSQNEALKNLNEIISEVLEKSFFRGTKLIMVVEDTTVIRNLVANGLQEAGFQVVTAVNGRAAMDIIHERMPDFVLSDIDMPEMNGFAFCQAIKADHLLCNIPFVVMSSHSERSHMKRMIGLGAVAYLVKPFSPDELAILIDKILSDHFLLLLKDKEHLMQEQQMMLDSIASLVHALEARDSYTRGHSESVAQIVSAMVAATGANQADIDLATIGAKLHDIGKIGVKDSVLLKEGKLTESEFSHIKAHPSIGSNILKSIPSLADIVPIVLYHHERMDGKGYPTGLKGDDIPLWARMTAVADTFNAMTSDRPYRKGMPIEKALHIIENVKGTQLCPDCVNLFMKIQC